MNRLEKLQARLKEANLPGLIVTNLKNVYYLTGFTGSAGVLLVTPDKAFFITDSRYTLQSKEQVKECDIRIHTQGVNAELKNLVDSVGLKDLAVEQSSMKVDQYLALQELLNMPLKTSDHLIEELRLIKDEEEIATMREACRITDLSFDHILKFIKPGVTEIQVANELDRFLKEHGASGMSFDTIIASGHRSALPHGVATDKVIEKGDIVTLDYGCYYKRYASDMTRTIAVGQPDPKLADVYQVVLDAHLAVIDKTKAGMTGKEIDSIARQYIDEKGYCQYFINSTGHGLGLDVHESPAISSRSNDRVSEMMVITDEPGIYIPELGGVRIEDDLIVRTDGVESLNQSPKELIII